MFSMQSQYNFIQSLKGEGTPLIPKEGIGGLGKKTPKETVVHDTTVKSEDQKKREVVKKKVKRTHKDYIKFEVGGK